MSRACEVCSADISHSRAGTKTCSRSCRGKRSYQNRILHFSTLPPITPSKNTKTCTACKNELPLEAFGKSRGQKDGLEYRCRECRAAIWFENRDEISRRQKERRKNNPDRYRAKKLREYGISLEIYEKMLANQGHACAACGDHESTLKTRLHVDHDHACCPVQNKSCGKCVRALLCGRCNTAAGQLLDSSARAQRLVWYLRTHGKACSRKKGRTK